MKFLGHYGMLGLVIEGDISPHGQLKNRKLCHCRVCGDELLKDQGFRWQYFWLDDEGRNRGTHVFLCSMCNAYWMTFFGYESDSVDQYLTRFNLKRIESKGTNFLVDMEIQDGWYQTSSGTTEEIKSEL